MKGTRTVKYLRRSCSRRLLLNPSKRRRAYPNLINAMWDGHCASRDYFMAACVQFCMTLTIGRRLSGKRCSEEYRI